MELRSQRLFLQIFMPLLSVGAAAYLTWVLPGLRNSSSLFLFLAAVICTTRLAGWMSGFIATALSAVVTAALFMGHGHGFDIHATEDVVRLLTFVVLALFILSLNASRAKSDRALRASQQRLISLSRCRSYGGLGLQLADSEFLVV